MFQRSLRAVKVNKNSFKRFYSDHHEEPLAPEANIFSSYLVTPVLFTIGALGFYQVDKSYRKLHNGDSIVSVLGSSFDPLKLNESFKFYDKAVFDERQLYELISFTPKYNKDRYPLHIDGVPGQYFPYNAASNFSANVDFNNLEERRKPINSLK